MSIAFYMDHHIQAAITEGLRRRGLDVITAYEDGLAAVDDEHLFARAAELGRVLVSQDRHMPGIAVNWMHLGRSFAGLIYMRPTGVSVGQAIAELETIATAAEPSELSGKIQFLPI